MAPALADGPRRRAGRPRQLDPRVADRICREFGYGLGYRAIATQLNLDGVSTAHGGRRWWPATVRAVLRSRGARP